MALLKKKNMGLLGLWTSKLKEKKTSRWKTATVNIPRAHSAPACLSPFSFANDSDFDDYGTKKGEERFAACQQPQGRFLSSIIASRAMTTTIAIIMPIDIGRKYCSAVVGGAVGCGVGVAGASTMLKAVSALDGQ